MISKGKRYSVIGLVSVNWQQSIIVCEVVEFFKGRCGDIFRIIILVEKEGNLFGFGIEIFIVGADTAQTSKLRAGSAKGTGGETRSHLHE